MQLLRRILRRFVEKFFGISSGVMPTAYGDTVADPLADRVLWKGHRPLLFAGLP